VFGDKNPEKPHRYVGDLRLCAQSLSNSGRTEESIANLKGICERECHGSYDLEVIDVLNHPEIAEARKIIAVPTLIMDYPLPVRRVIGDFSDQEKTLAGMGLFLQSR
jgi:circadian clock protein KaiB